MTSDGQIEIYDNAAASERASFAVWVGLCLTDDERPAEWLAQPTITCKNEGGLQTVTQQYEVTGGAKFDNGTHRGATLTFEASVASYERRFLIGNYTHVVAAGTPKIAFNIEGVPFGGKVRPPRCWLGAL